MLVSRRVSVYLGVFLIVGLGIGPLFAPGVAAEDQVPTVWPDGTTHTYYVATGCLMMKNPEPLTTQAQCDLARNRATAYSQAINFIVGGLFWVRVWKSVNVGADGMYFSSITGTCAGNAIAGLLAYAKVACAYEVVDSDTGVLVAGGDFFSWESAGIGTVGGSLPFTYAMYWPGAAGHHYWISLKVTVDAEAVLYGVATADAITNNPNNALKGIWFTSVSVRGEVPRIEPATQTVGSNPNCLVYPTVDFYAMQGGVPPIAYSWTFGDGGTGTGQIVEHTYPYYAQTWPVNLYVTDAIGHNSHFTGSVTVRIVRYC